MNYFSPSIGEFPGLCTDLFVRHPATRYTSDAGYLAYQTPARPDYWWGTYLVSVEPVTIDNLPKHSAAWHQRLGGIAGITKKIIEWEVPLANANAADLLVLASAAGASVYQSTVLLAERAILETRQANPADQLTIRRASSEGDVAAILDMALADLACEPDSPATADFLRWKHGQFAASVQSGNGDWWMLERDGELVGNCGLFADAGVGRFREVITDPAWRRRGFARALCAAVMADAFERSKVDKLVIVAERNSSAERIYRSLGFVPHSAKVALVWDACNQPRT